MRSLEYLMFSPALVSTVNHSAFRSRVRRLLYHLLDPHWCLEELTCEILERYFGA